MLLETQRELIVTFGLKLLSSGLTTGSGGNLSCICREQDLIAIGPSGVDYADVRVEDVVIVNRAGEVVEGNSTHRANSVFISPCTRRVPK